MAVSQAYPGQVGKGVVKIYDADGNETTNWDVGGGISYQSSDESVATVVDTDANPQDCQVTAHAVGQARITCSFDGKVGSDTNMIVLEANVEVVAPPPGAAVGGTFEVVFEQVS